MEAGGTRSNGGIKDTEMREDGSVKATQLIDTSGQKPKPLTISHEVVACPTAKDFDNACQAFCAYTRTNLTPYMARKRSGGTYQEEVMQVMGCLSFV